MIRVFRLEVQSTIRCPCTNSTVLRAAAGDHDELAVQWWWLVRKSSKMGVQYEMTSTASSGDRNVQRTANVRHAIWTCEFGREARTKPKG